MTKSGIRDFGRWITFDRNICNLALCYVAPLWQQQFCRLLLFFSHWKLRVGHVISFASSLANVRPQRRRACVSLTHLPSAEQLHTSQQQSSSSIAFSDLLREIPPRATVRRKKALAVQSRCNWATFQKCFWVVGWSLLFLTTFLVLKKRELNGSSERSEESVAGFNYCCTWCLMS